MQFKKYVVFQGTKILKVFTSEKDADNYVTSIGRNDIYVVGTNVGI